MTNVITAVIYIAVFGLAGHMLRDAWDRFQ